MWFDCSAFTIYYHEHSSSCKFGANIYIFHSGFPVSLRNRLILGHSTCMILVKLAKKWSACAIHKSTENRLFCFGFLLLNWPHLVQMLKRIIKLCNDFISIRKSVHARIHERRRCLWHWNWQKSKLDGKSNAENKFFIIYYPFCLFSLRCLKLLNEVALKMEKPTHIYARMKSCAWKIPIIRFIYSEFLFDFAVVVVGFLFSWKNNHNHNRQYHDMCITFGQFSRKVMNVMFVNHLSDVSGNLPYD